MSKTKKIFLNESDMPRQWYNVVPDMENKPLPPLHPLTRQPLGPYDLKALFPEELIKQEVSMESYIDIPEEVQEIYKIWRPTPLIRAYNLEKMLDTPARIYYKNESVSPAGSHKPNTAVAQAYYNSKEGVKKISTETGAGQWGSALSFACNAFNIELKIFMVGISYKQKPYRRSMMNTWGAEVIPSPSSTTESGRKILSENSNSPGSLGIAISEAIELAASNADTKYSLGSVLNHVLLHQTIIGEESMKQMEMTGDYPDTVIACFGGGSNFAGIAFPFLRENLRRKAKTKIIAVESASCPKLTRGRFQYDFGDTIGLTPLIPMYTLGHDFIPAEIHAGGLRYHGAGSIVSQLLKDKYISASAIQQVESFKAAKLFSMAEGILPAPESSHAIAQVIREANLAKEHGEKRNILFNLSGHGHFDMSAYDKFMSGDLKDYNLNQDVIDKSLCKVEDFV